MKENDFDALLDRIDDGLWWFITRIGVPVLLIQIVEGIIR